ncbi:MAG: AbrB family DNA-binding protein [Desulfurococcales archaeon]|nr:AbrB family DNA-binding protein [Desulfurococcales archaeon]
MRLTAIVKVDSKGRITIPQTMRETIGVEPGMLMAVIADTDKREIIVSPIYGKGNIIYEVEVALIDRPGAIAQVADALARNNIDVIAQRCTTIMRGQEGSCTIIVDMSKSPLTEEELKNLLVRLDVVTQVRVKKFETHTASI